MRTILVPQGAEFQTVQRGCKLAGSATASVQVIPIAIGSVALQKQLRELFTTERLNQTTEVVVMGLCGSLSPSYRVGDIVGYAGCLGGRVPSTWYPCDPLLTATLLSNLGAVSEPDAYSPNAHSDAYSIDTNQPPVAGTSHPLLVTCWTSDRLLWLASEKQQLGKTVGADVVDMEAAVILETLASVYPAITTPVAMIRVVSDNVEQTLPDLTTAFSEEGLLRPLPLALAMLRQPIAALHLVRSSLHSLNRLQTAATIVAKTICTDHPTTGTIPHHPGSSPGLPHL